MIKLEDFLYKYVRVDTVNGVVYLGEVDLYSSATDSGDDEDSIGIIIDGQTKEGVGLFLSEIKSIEIVGRDNTVS